MTTYSIKMASGETFTWTASDLTVACSLNARGFLPLPSGTLINVAHIESMTPIGTTGPEAEVSP